MRMNLPCARAERLPSGTMRYRFRRDDRKITLRGEPRSRKFLESDDAALPGRPQPWPSTIPQGSIGWRAGTCLEAAGRTRALAPVSLEARAALPKSIIGAKGDRSARSLDAADVRAILAGRNGTTGAKNALTALRGMYRRAIAAGIRGARDPTEGSGRRRRAPKDSAPRPSRMSAAPSRPTRRPPPRTSRCTSSCGPPAAAGTS